MLYRRNNFINKSNESTSLVYIQHKFIVNSDKLHLFIFLMYLKWTGDSLLLSTIIQEIKTQMTTSLISL